MTDMENAEITERSYSIRANYAVAQYVAGVTKEVLSEHYSDIKGKVDICYLSSVKSYAVVYWCNNIGSITVASVNDNGIVSTGVPNTFGTINLTDEKEVKKIIKEHLSYFKLRVKISCDFDNDIHAVISFNKSRVYKDTAEYNNKLSGTKFFFKELFSFIISKLKWKTKTTK